MSFFLFNLHFLAHVILNVHPFLYHHHHRHTSSFVFIFIAHSIHCYPPSLSPLLTQSNCWKRCDYFIVLKPENYSNTVTWFTCDSMDANYRWEFFLFNSSLSSFSMPFYNIRVFYSFFDEFTYPL